MNSISFYKVIFQLNYRRGLSAIVLDKAVVEYVVDQWAKPPKFLEEQGYGLLVFDSLQAARTFANRWGAKFSVWRCLVEGIHTKLPPQCYLSPLSGHGVLVPNGRDWPEHTFMVDNVMILQEIESWRSN